VMMTASRAERSPAHFMNFDHLDSGFARFPDSSSIESINLTAWSAVLIVSTSSDCVALTSTWLRKSLSSISRPRKITRLNRPTNPMVHCVFHRKRSPGRRLDTGDDPFYRTAVAANFFTIASSSLRSLSFKFDE